MDALEARLNAICDPLPFTTGWYVKDLATGRTASRLGVTILPSASTRKISIMMAAFRAAHQGRFDLDLAVPLAPELNKGVNGGTLRYMAPGHPVRLREAIIHMIITSDNVGTRIVTDRLPMEEINEHCRSIGLERTVHRQGVPAEAIPYDHALEDVTTTTPADQGRLLEMILAGENDEAAARRLGSTPALCRYALEILSWQLYRDRIPAFLPLDTKVANKTGGGRRGQMDAGIVYRNGRPSHVITVYTDRVPLVTSDGLPGFVAAFQTIGKLSRLCWDELGGQA